MKYSLTVEVDEDRVKAASGCDDVLEAIKNEAGWLRNSGINMVSVELVDDAASAVDEAEPKQPCPCDSCDQKSWCEQTGNVCSDVDDWIREETSEQSFELTDNGREIVESYIRELEAKRKEILDAGRDTADETTLPTIEDIVADICFCGIDWDDPDGPCYYNGWSVTDNYGSDYPVLLKYERDFVEVSK